MADSVRLDKVLSDSGVCTRREAGRLIRRGVVLVDGTAARSGAEKINPEKVRVTCDGKPVIYVKFRYLIMNKPAGVVSATMDAEEKTVLDLLDEPLPHQNLRPAGRLDKDAEGLLVLTNDGAFVHKIISPKHEIEKTYYVETDGGLSDSDCAAFESGITLKDGYCCLPARLEIIRSEESSAAFVFVREGKYHQVKRMLASLGKPVTYLKRTAIGGLILDPDLSAGQCREMTDAERELITRKNAELREMREFLHKMHK